MHMKPQWRQWRLSLRTWLLAVSVLSMLPLLAAVVYGILLSQHEAQRRMEDHLQAHALEISSQLEQRIQMAVSTLNTLAESSAAQQGDLQALYNAAKRVVASNPGVFRAVTLVNREEELVFVTSLPLGGPTFTPNHINLVRDVFEKGAVNVSGPFVTPIRPDPLVAVAVPLRQNGQVTYCLRMVLPVDSISDVLKTAMVAPGWTAVVTDRDGVVLARSAHAERFVGGRVAAEAMVALRKGERSFFHLVTLDGIPSTALLVPVHGGDWYLGLSAPDSVLEAAASQSLRYLLWGSVLGLLCAVAFSQWLAAYLMRQTQAMVDALGSVSADQPLRVAEFWAIVQRFWQAEQTEAALGRELDQVSTQRDEVRDLYDNAPCGYHSLNAEGRIVEINQTELDWMGCTREEVLGLPYTNFCTDAGKETFRVNFAKFMAQGEIHDLEFELVRKDGSTFPVLISATAIKHPDGTLAMSRSTVFDNTERKAHEAALQRAHTELARERDLLETRVHERTLELAKARDEAESSNRIKTALLSNVSHELRTPLNHIMGNAYLLAQGLSDAEQQEQAEAISRASKELLVMVNDLIDVSQLEGQTLQLVAQNLELRALLERVVQQAQPALTGKDIQLVLALDPALPAVLVGDGERLMQVLRHLVDNAIKFSERGQVTVRVNRVANGGQLVGVRFEVEDQGIGISNELRTRLFSLLEQGDGSATRLRGGNGLGLALSQRLVTLMGGHIVVEAVQPHGSCFWFELTLPVAQADALAEPVPDKTVVSLNAMAKHMEALLQDDDAEARALWHQNQQALSKLLKDQASAFAQAIENFEFPEALEILRACRG